MQPTNFHILDHVLITGGHGMVGRNIKFGFKPTSSEMDVTDEDSIKNYVKTREISCIIHLASINLRTCEGNYKKAVDVNINGTTNMVKIAMNKNIPFVFISTGAVFSSLNSDELFDENSQTSPNCVYGFTKNSAEKISKLYEKSIIIRTGWLFGGHQTTHYKFVETAVNNFKSNTPIYCSNDFFGSPTYVVDFVERMKELIINLKYGLHHVVNKGISNGVLIAEEIASEIGASFSLIQSVKSDSVPNSGPMRSKTESLNSINSSNIMRHWKMALKEYVILFVKNNYHQCQTEQKTHEINNLQSEYWSERTICRLCDSSQLRTFFKLEPTPPANHFVKIKKTQQTIPLDLCICVKCQHIQLMQIVNPDYQYSNYLYVSSTSATMKNHLETNVIKFTEILNLTKIDNILEIGANDGACINHLLKHDFVNVVGVDPAKNINNLHSLPIICDFFGTPIVPILKKKYENFKLIYAFHCLAHIENIQDVFSAVYDLLDDDGFFIMEVGYFYEVFKNKLFDTIYHEHIDYHTCTSMLNFSKSFNLSLYNVLTNDIQGGSIQFYFSKNQHVQIHENVQLLIEKEHHIQLFNLNTLDRWKNQIVHHGVILRQIVNALISNNKKIVGYGAPAKLTTFLYQYNFSTSSIKYIVDDNFMKHNLYSPGKHVQIKPVSSLEKIDYYYIIIFAWNFSNEIILKLEPYRKHGVKIIIPFPEIRII